MTSCRPECAARDSDYDCSLARCFCQCHRMPRDGREFTVLEASKQTSERCDNIPTRASTDDADHSGPESPEEGISSQPELDDFDRLAWEFSKQWKNFDWDEPEYLDGLARYIREQRDEAWCAAVKAMGAAIIVENMLPPNVHERLLRRVHVFKRKVGKS